MGLVIINRTQDQVTDIAQTAPKKSTMASRRKSILNVGAQKSVTRDVVMPEMLAKIMIATLPLNKDSPEIFRPHFYYYASLSISTIICFVYFIALS